MDKKRDQRFYDTLFGMYYEQWFMADGHLEAFFEFEGRFNSLQRYYAFGVKYMESYLLESESALEELDDPASDRA